MTRSRPLAIFSVLVLIFIKAGTIFAQAPNISYTSPQNYTVNTAITPLVPKNTGGAVPATVYGQVSTFAGSRRPGDVDGTGTNVSFYGPNGIVADATGTLYISDGAVVRKITAAGVVTTFAGSGMPGSVDGQGVAASFNAPVGLAIDVSGNLYVADVEDNLIRKITLNGLVSTFAGSDAPNAGQQGSLDGTLLSARFIGPFGLVFDSAGNLFVSEYYGDIIRKIDKTGQVTTFAGLAETPGAINGTGSSSRFWEPSFLTIDASDNIYVADYDNGMIRKITPAGIVTIIYNNNSPGFAMGTGIASDAFGNVYFADNIHGIIKKVNSAGLITTVAGNGISDFADGAPSKASFNNPNGVAVDGLGNLYVADGGNYLVRKISITGYAINKTLPPGLTFDSTTGIISGTPTASSPATNYTITAYNTDGTSSTIVNIAVGGNSGPAIIPPDISYQTPQTYTVSNAITPLAPKNTGGAVPPNNYAQVTTFAGTGVTGSKDGTGTSASFSAPISLTVDGSGNIYVADYNNNTVRKITPAGVVTTLAGTPGVHGSADGTGANASFAEPDGVAADKNGNVYVADSYNNLIRKIAPGGVVTTFAGSNGIIGSADGTGINATFNSPAGLAVDNAGNIYVADKNNNEIRKITPLGVVTTLAGSTTSGKTDGTGPSARFNLPESVTVDAAGNVYVTDTWNNLIRKITPAGAVTTLAGSGATGASDGPGAAASFYLPYGITADNNGTLYVADEKNNLIRKISPNDMVSTIAGTGTGGSGDGIGKNATFGYPGSVATDGTGNIYVGDLTTYLIRKVGLTGYEIDRPLPPGLIFDSTTGIISGTPTAPSPATDYTVTAYNISGSSSAVVNIAVNGSTPVVLAPDISYQTPQTYTVNTVIAPLEPKNTGGAVPATLYGQVSTIAGSGAIGAVNGAALTASFHTPVGIAVDAAGNIYLGDDGNSIIRKIAGGVVTTFAGSGNKGSTDGPAASASFNAVFGVAVDAAGNVYVADEGNNLIRKVSPAGVVTTLAGSGVVGATNGTGIQATFNHPYGVAVDGQGNVYVAEGANDLIRKITSAGVVTTFAGSGSPGSADGNGILASFKDPEGIAADPAGDVYVGDCANYLVRKITSAGIVSTLAGNGAAGSANGIGNLASFNYPYGLTVDGAGNVYVADQLNNLVRKITPAGLVTTLAGSGAASFADGVGTSASFNTPSGMTVDAAGNVYVVDSYNNKIRKITTTGYTIDKPLPPGLTFDRATGIISGIPTAVSPAADYTVTAYNAGGSSSTVVNIAVKDNEITLPLPPDIHYQTPQTYKVSTTISPLAPTNTGGAVPANAYGKVTTFSGSGGAGNFNSAGTPVSFPGPTGLGIDVSGNLYVTEYTDNSITKITTAGVVSTLTGGSKGANNGPGNTASFFAPYDVVADVSGNLYVSDEGNQMIRKIAPDGTTSTYAGTGTKGSANGADLSASFDNPVSLVFNAGGDLYVGDRGNSLIRKVDVMGQVTDNVSLAANDGTAAGLAITYMATDALGNLYVSDNNWIVKINLAGVVTKVAGNGTPGFADGTGAAASFNRLEGLAVDAIGNIYAADADNNAIRKVSPAGVVTTLAGNGTRSFADGTGANARFFAPYGVKIDNTGNFLYTADAGNNYLRKIAVTGYSIDKALPPGLTFDPTTGVISGTPTAASPATDYTVTAYNTGGSSSATLNIAIINEQTVIFGPIPAKTVCDADFDPGATGDGPMTYTSNNTSVATIVSGQIHIIGAGTSVITASDGTSTAVQTLTVTAALIPSITISPALQDNCAGSAVTYTAMPLNGGTSPSYQWLVNGQNAGTNSLQFSSSNLNNNDQVTCILTSSAVCTTSATATSNTAAFILDPPVTTSVTIISTATGPVCAGIPVTFIATPVTTDNNPTYQWQVSGASTGSNSPVFTSTNLGSGDVVTCILSSASKCVVNPSTTSNPITINLSPASACIVIIPNTFTPNGDGINDFWNITDLQSYPACTINIFNRYGTLVYNSVGYPKSWDGNFNGKPLPAGTYYYIIDLKNGKNKLAGSVTIVR